MNTSTEKSYNLKTSDNSIQLSNIGGLFSTCPEVINHTKKELQNNDYMILRYAAMQLIEQNLNNIGFYQESGNELYNLIDNQASISDNSLYLGEFEGYQLLFDENLILDSLELDLNNRIIACILDVEADNFKYYLID